MKIEMKHGSGGEAMDELIKQCILKNIGGKEGELPLTALDDASVIDGIALSTDSYTVKPIFFPGGDIGKLAVSGTVNDVSMIGAKPIALSCGLIIEEGYDSEDLNKIMESIGKTSSTASVPVITGDTKVIEKGGVDQIFINTCGIGVRSKALENNIEIINKYREFKKKWLTDSNVRDDDVIICSGYLGDHGVSVLSFREGYGFESTVKSDVAPLNKMIEKILNIGGIVAMKDPTRGGLSNTLNEWKEKSGIGIEIEEKSLPIREAVHSATDLLGIDPLEIGNEGKVIIAVVPEKAEEVLATLRETEEGKDAQIIGRATKNLEYVILNTLVGGKRIVEKPIGDPIPRIC